MNKNNNMHSNIQSRQFNTFKSLLLLAKIRNFAFGAFVFGLFSLGAFVHGASVRGASVRGVFVHGAFVRSPMFMYRRILSQKEIIILILLHYES